MIQFSNVIILFVCLRHAAYRQEIWKLLDTIANQLLYSMADIFSTFFDSTVFLGYVSRSWAVECCAAAAEIHSWPRKESADTRQPMRTLLSDKRVNGFSPLNILYLEYSDANYVPDKVISIGFCSGDHLDVLLRYPGSRRWPHSRLEAVRENLGLRPRPDRTLASSPHLYDF